MLLLGIYLLTTGGQTFISDGDVMLLTAVRMVDAQTITLPSSAAAFPQVVRGVDGSLYSYYGLGQPVLAAACYWVGRYVIGWYLLPGSDDFRVGKFFALLLPAAATALTGAVLCAWATRLFRSVRVGVSLALLYGAGTLAWPYSRFFFSEPLFTACLVLAGFALHRQRPVLAGLAFGYALATRVAGVVLLPAFLLYTLSLSPCSETERVPLRWRTLLPGLRVCGLFLLGSLPGVALILVHNLVRFHTLTDQGYGDQSFTGNLLIGLYGLLFSPGKSVFLYAPLLLALPLAGRSFVQQHRAEALLVGSLATITLVESALWWTWWGGWGWGPRFLVPLLPFLVLLLGMLMERRCWQRRILIALLPLALVVNLCGILVDFNPYLIETTHGEEEREAIYLYQPAYSPLWAHWQRIDPAHIPIVSFDLSNPAVGFPPWAAPLLSWGVVLSTVGAGVQVWRLSSNCHPDSTYFSP